MGLFKKSKNKVVEVEKQIVKPLQLQKTVEDTFSKIVFDRDSGSFKVKRITKIFNFNPVTREKLSRKPIATKTELLPLSVLGDRQPLKEITVPCVIRKIGFDSLLNEISVYVLRHLEIRVINDPVYSYLYLVKDLSKIHKLPFKIYLPNGLTAPIQFRGTEQGIDKNWLDSEQLVSDAEAEELKRNGALMLVKKGKEYEIGQI